MMFGMPLTSDAQNSKKKLESNKRKIERKIKYTRKLLNETRNLKKASLNEISLLNSQIRNRKELVRVYGMEVKQADKDIVQKEEQIKALEKDLLQLKAEYGNLIYQSYKARNKGDQWMYIFASKDFYQAYNRIKYLQEVNEYQRAKADEIEQNKKQLQEEILRLEELKKNRLQLLLDKENEAKKLLKNKVQKQEKVRNISNKEKELRSRLKKQQREWRQLNDKIKKIIEAQMRKTDKGSTRRIPLSPAEAALGKSFAGNKGKLPWPSERGQIVSNFGKSPHPTLHVFVDNKGIDIRCEKGAYARAVFKGKVKSVIQLPQYQAVLVQHGNYFTVYSNLSRVFVKEGDMLDTKEKVGVVKENDDGETILHFELWSSKINSPVNPKYWIL